MLFTLEERPIEEELAGNIMGCLASMTTVVIAVESSGRVQLPSLGKSPLHHFSIEVTVVNIMPSIDFVIIKSYFDLAIIIDASIIIAELELAATTDSHKMAVSFFGLSVCHLSSFLEEHHGVAYCFSRE